MKIAFAVIISLFLSLLSDPALADSCDAVVLFDGSSQDDDGWVTSEFTVVVSDCARSQGDFNYTIYWTDEDGESGKPIQRVGNWGVQDTSEDIQVTERDQLADGQFLQVVEAGDPTRCVCHD